MISSIWLRYIKGACTAEEERRLEAWLDAEPGRRGRAEALRGIWGASGERPVHADVDAAWKKVARRLDGPVPADRKAADRGPRRPARRAGSPVLVASLLVIGVALLTLIVSRFLYAPAPVAVAEAGPQPRVYTTQRGQQATVRLIDGTQIRLNVESKLTVPADFSAGRREVEIEGEAYLEVARNVLYPFVVRAGEAEIEVLGTVFGVRVFDDGSRVRVVVAEGGVSLTDARRDSVVLRPRQMGEIVQGRLNPVREAANPESYLSWIRGEIVFQAASFDEVAAELERWFDLEVDATVPAAKIDRLNASFTGDEYLSEILNVIASTLNLEYQRDATRRRVVFYPEANGQSVLK